MKYVIFILTAFLCVQGFAGLLSGGPAVSETVVLSQLPPPGHVFVGGTWVGGWVGIWNSSIMVSLEKGGWPWFLGSVAIYLLPIDNVRVGVRMGMVGTLTDPLLALYMGPTVSFWI